MIEIRQAETYKKWFETMKNRNARMRVNIRVRRLSLGNLGDVKPVGGGVSEVRIDYGPGYRVYFVQKQKRIILLLLGGDKSTQSKDIQKAQELAVRIGELE